MREKLIKLIDVKSIVTLLLVVTLVIIILNKVEVDKDIFLLFSNLITMIITYFFTKKSSGEQK